MAVRKTQGKLEWHLLPPECVEPVIEVLMMGKLKYSENNWKEEPLFTREQITNSMKRHQAAIEKGELLDSESGLLHSAHVACNALFQVYYDSKGLWDHQTDITECDDCVEFEECKKFNSCYRKNHNL